MANRAFISIWIPGFAEASMLETFGKVLGTVPFSASQPGITGLVIRAVGSWEAPLEEHDLRAAPATPDGCITLARFHESFDCAYEARCYWDQWTDESGSWQLAPRPLEIACLGEQYDDGAFQQAGHVRIDLGFAESFVCDESPGGQAKRSENIRALYMWLRQIRDTVAIGRQVLWSEEDESLEAQLDAALAQS